MGVQDRIHFNSNEEYERSVFQFVQMTGNMSIKEAKRAMDGLVERVLPAQDFLTYRCGGGRNRQGSTLYVFDTGYRFQNSRERIFAHTLKNTRREDGGSEYYGLFIQRESLLRDDIRAKTGCWHIGDIVFSDMNELNELLGHLAEEALYGKLAFYQFSDQNHPSDPEKLPGKHLFPALPSGKDLHQRGRGEDAAQHRPHRRLVQ